MARLRRAGTGLAPPSRSRRRLPAEERALTWPGAVSARCSADRARRRGRYCENKIPPQHRDELRVECDVRSKSITLFECRPPWQSNLGPDWSRQPVAQPRYDPADHHWWGGLYCADRNSRWHYYDVVEPTPRLDELLDGIEEDPTGIL